MITTEIYFYKNTDVEVITFTDDEGNESKIYDFIVDGRNRQADTWTQVKATIDKFKDQQ
jgi:hypothetical protein